LDRFPIGTFAGLARVLVDQLIKEEAARASFARQEEEVKHAQDAKDAVDRARVEELAAARDELRKAQAALKAAEVERETARTMAEEARKVAEAAKASMAKATAEAPKVASAETRLSQDPVIDHAMLVRSIQMELKRVGCEPGIIDGKWGTDARDAFRRFIRFAKIDLQSEEPSEAVLIAVTRQMQRVCPAPSDSRSSQPHRRDAAKRRVAREPSKQPAETEKRGSKGLCWSYVGGRQLAVQPCN
jgi:multidrug efflux pump subunit AcrA (membrane-fusion protein)